LPCCRDPEGWGFREAASGEKVEGSHVSGFTLRITFHLVFYPRQEEENIGAQREEEKGGGISKRKIPRKSTKGWEGKERRGITWSNVLKKNGGAAGNQNKEQISRNQEGKCKKALQTWDRLGRTKGLGEAAVAAGKREIEVGEEKESRWQGDGVGDRGGEKEWEGKESVDRKEG